MSYPKTGEEVYVSLNLSNTMLTGIGKGTITREEVSADYLKRLFARYGVIVSAKPEQRRLLVARGAGDLHRRSEEGLVRFAVDGARRLHLWEHALRDIEFGEDLVVPFKFPYIIKQRARSV